MRFVHIVLSFVPADSAPFNISCRSWDEVGTIISEYANRYDHRTVTATAIFEESE